jgi:uncharacterized membrane protein
MNRVTVVVFDDEKRAYEGLNAIRDLHRDGTLTVYADAVIAKDAGGKVAVRQAPDDGPLGTLSGFTVGTLVGLLGGPIGVAIGAGTGTVIGAAWDVTRAEIGNDFIAEVSEFLLPGKAAVIGEMDEDWQAPLDARMEALGGQVFRRNRIQVEDAYFEKEIAAYEAELEALEAEHARASKERRARIKARMQATRTKLETRKKELKARVDEVKREGDAKVESLRKQIALASQEQKESLRKRHDKVRAEYEERTAKLQQAWQLTKSALTP